MIDFLKRGFLLLLILLCSHSVDAQSTAAQDGKLGTMRSYRKVSGNSQRLRTDNGKQKKQSSKQSSKKKKQVKKQAKKQPKKSSGKSAVVKKTEKPAAKSVKIDSVQYTPRNYTLGERVIMPGDSGRDVRNVANILVKKLYIDEAEVVYTADGGVLYNDALQRAVKHFQEFNGFYPDGIIGNAVVKALRKRKQ
jgi:murein L,D-transpeptidase YcbB/YkuD